MRAVFLRLVAATLGVLFALGAAELAFRLLAGPPAAPPPDPEITVASSSRMPQFRKTPWGPEKSPETFRVMVVGDSFTWGWGVRWDQTYAYRLQRWLPRLDSERHFHVVNWSRPGWNSWDEWLSLRDAIAIWQPDALVVGYVFNDAESSDLEIRDERRQVLQRRAPGGLLGTTLFRWSRLAQRLVGATENRRMRRELVAYYHRLYEEDGWEQNKRALRRMRGAARELDIPILLVLFPIFDSQLDDEYAYRDLHELLASTARTLQIPHLDLLPSYEGIDGRELAAVPFTDAHPSPLAHRIAAQAILERLVEDEMIPATMPVESG